MHYSENPTSPGHPPSGGANTVAYDAEGRIISTSNSGGSGSYNYSGDSIRVHQVSITTGGTTTSNSVYLGSNLIGQYDNQSGALGENIFLGGQRIAAVGGASVTNGGFEAGSTGWTLTGVGASIVTNAAKAHSGNNYVQISTTSSATAQSPTFAVHPGDRIDFGGWVYLETGTAAAVDWVLMTLDSNHNQVATVVPTPWSVTTAGVWTYETGSYQVASNVAYVYFYANVFQSSGTTTARFDDGFAIFGTHYFHADQLSTRVVTDATGSVIGQQGHFPYGELWYPTSGNPTTNWQFTSYQRDAESGNDYAMARSYVNRLARFSSPDPAGLAAVDFSNPQSWNRYAYVLNNPLANIDPLGLDPCQGMNSFVFDQASDGTGIFDLMDCILNGGSWDPPDTTVNVSASPLPSPSPSQNLGGLLSNSSGGGESPTIAAIKAFFSLPSTGKGSCIDVALSSAQDPLKHLRDDFSRNVSKYLAPVAPMVPGAANQVGSLNQNNLYSFQPSVVVGWKTLTGPSQVYARVLSTLGIASTAVLSAASSAVTSVLADAGPLTVVGADALAAYGVLREYDSAFSGQCKP